MSLSKLFLTILAASAISSASLAPIATAGARAPQTSKPAFQDKFITVNGLKIHYLDWGSDGKQPLIMLHGISKSAHSFDPVAPQFNKDYHVIAMDIRGHGDSDWSPEGAYTVEDMEKDLEGLVDQLKLKNFILLGNSTGARIVQLYTGMHPDRVARLIIEDVSPARSVETATRVDASLTKQEPGFASEDEVVADLLRQDKRIPEDVDRNFAHYATKTRADGRLDWKRDPGLNKGFVPTDLWDYVKKITCPTIFILGAQSKNVSPDDQVTLKASLPKLQIVILPNAGHYPSVETTDAYVKTVKVFLGS